MAEIGTFEAKNKLSELLGRVEKGEEITITRHGKPVARLVPLLSDDERRERARRAVEWIKKMRRGNSLGSDTAKGLIEEGRR